jgi:hypothetical protein
LHPSKYNNAEIVHKAIPKLCRVGTKMKHLKKFFDA